MILKKLLENISTTAIEADCEMEITGVGSDSATVRPGELFVAIAGYKTDGHRYIGDAVKKGASCVICQTEPDTEVPYVITDDSRKALAGISAAWFGHPAKKMKIIGVTGTNGKTSVTHLVRHIIEKCSGSKVGLIGTIGNMIGTRELASTLTTPDSYELQSTLDKMAFEGCDYVVMEVSSHALCLHRVYGIDFRIGIFTNLTPEHMDFHHTMQEYANAKAMLFPNCRSSCINADDMYADRMIGSSKGNVLTYTAAGAEADITAGSIRLHPDKTEFDIRARGETARAVIHIPGMFSVYNALAAAGAGLLLGYEMKDIVNALFTCPGVKGRAETVPAGGDFTVIIDYAHTPDALENIIKTARATTSGRVITLFGCGGDRDKAKRPLMGKAAVQLSDIVFITSDNPRTEEPGEIIKDILTGIENQTELCEKGRLKVIESRREAICKALDILLLGDMLVIAGKGHETYQILGTEKTHFDDREAVSEHLRYLRESRRKEPVRTGELI